MREGSLRVGYVVRYLPSTSETFVLDELASLRSQGCWTQVWALDHDSNAVRHRRHQALYDQAVVVPRSSSLRCRFSALGMEENPAFPAVHRNWEVHGRPRDLRRVAWLARSLKAHAVDLVRVHHAAEVGRHAVAAALMANLPVAVAVHARDLFVPVDDLPWILRNAALVTTVTPFHRDRLLRLGLPSQGVAIHPCAVDLPTALAEPPVDNGRLRLLSVGRLVPKKGHDLLLDACGEVARSGQAIHLSVIGGGPEEGRLRAQKKGLVEALGPSLCERLEVEFLGSLPNEEVLRRMDEGRFHAGVLACRLAPDGDRDGLPVFLLEAQAHGLPIVTSNLPGFDYEFVNDEGAILVPVHSNRGAVEPQSEFLISALQALGRNPGSRSHLAKVARQRAEDRVGIQEAGIHLGGLLSRLCGREFDVAKKV